MLTRRKRSRKTRSLTPTRIIYWYSGCGGFKRLQVKVTPCPGTNIISGRTVSSICFKIKEEMVRGMASPDPTPT